MKESTPNEQNIFHPFEKEWGTTALTLPNATAVAVTVAGTTYFAFYFSDKRATLWVRY